MLDSDIYCWKEKKTAVSRFPMSNLKEKLSSPCYYVITIKIMKQNIFLMTGLSCILCMCRYRSFLKPLSHMHCYPKIVQILPG